MTSISPFALLVNANAIKAAARRAEMLDLPRRRSPRFAHEQRTHTVVEKTAEDLELDSILDEIEAGSEDADFEFLLCKLSGVDPEEPGQYDGDLKEADVMGSVDGATLPLA